MPVSYVANRVVIDSQEGTDSANVITLASGTIRDLEGADNGSREGADSDSSGAKRKYVPVLASPSNSSQISGGASQVPGADAERYKLSDLD